MRGRPSKYLEMLRDKEVARWYGQVSQGSRKTAKVYLRRLGYACDRYKTTPRAVAKLDRRGMRDFMVDMVNDMDTRGNAGGYREDNEIPASIQLVVQSHEIPRDPQMHPIRGKVAGISPWFSKSLTILILQYFMAHKEMPINWEFTRQTKANLPEAMACWMRPEDLPRLNPDVFKHVSIRSKDSDTVIYEVQFVLIGRKFTSVMRQTLDKDKRIVLADTTEGDGKGSKVIHAFRELPNGTEVKYSAALELGRLGFLAKGGTKSAFEKVADATVRELDARTA